MLQCLLNQLSALRLILRSILSFTFYLHFILHSIPCSISCLYSNLCSNLYYFLLCFARPAGETLSLIILFGNFNSLPYILFYYFEIYIALVFIFPAGLGKSICNVSPARRVKHLARLFANLFLCAIQLL